MLQKNNNKTEGDILTKTQETYLCYQPHITSNLHPLHVATHGSLNPEPNTLCSFSFSALSYVQTLVTRFIVLLIDSHTHVQHDSSKRERKLKCKQTHRNCPSLPEKKQPQIDYYLPVDWSVTGKEPIAPRTGNEDMVEAY